MRDPIVIFGAPEASADMFHVIPEGIVDPFLYVEDGDRRVATVSVLDAGKVEAHGIEILDAALLGRGLLGGGPERGGPGGSARVFDQPGLEVVQVGGGGPCGLRGGHRVVDAWLVARPGRRWGLAGRVHRGRV